MKYFYLKNDEKVGPISLEDLSAAEINKDTLIWYEGIEDWTPMSEIEELKSVLEIKPPPIPIVPSPVPEVKLNLKSTEKLKSPEANLSSMIYLDENGITIIASENAIIGEEYELNGEKYKVVDDKMLRDMVKNKEDVTRVVTSHITDMKNLFNWVTSFNQNIDSWDTSNVTDMQGMFSVATSFNQDISNWDISQVTNMNNMFIGAKSFNQNLSKWDVGNVKSMQNIFRDATSFDQDLSNWNSEGLHNALAWKAKNNQDMFSSPFSFDGRIRRTEYNISVIILIILSSCVNAAALSSDLPFLYFTYIPIFWLMWAQGAKRCHDLGQSGLFQIIPFYFIMMIFSEGKSEVNEYGKSPK